MKGKWAGAQAPRKTPARVPTPTSTRPRPSTAAARASCAPRVTRVKPLSIEGAASESTQRRGVPGVPQRRAPEHQRPLPAQGGTSVSSSRRLIAGALSHARDARRHGRRLLGGRRRGDGADARLLAGGSGPRSPLTSPHIQKTGLALAGFHEYLQPGRVLIFGESEVRFLESRRRRRASVAAPRLDARLALRAVHRRLVPPDRVAGGLRRAGVPLLGTAAPTGDRDGAGSPPGSKTAWPSARSSTACSWTSSASAS